MVDQDINFTLNFVDNITASVNRIEQSVGSLDKRLEALMKSTRDQEISFMAQVKAVKSVDMGYRGLVNVGSELGLVTGNLEKGLRGVGLAIHGVSSAFQLLKGARQILIMLRAAEGGVATVEAFRAGLKGKMGLVLLSLSAAAGVGGYFMGRSSVNNNTTANITFAPGDVQSQREMAKGTLSIIGG